MRDVFEDSLHYLVRLDLFKKERNHLVYQIRNNVSVFILPLNPEIQLDLASSLPLLLITFPHSSGLALL